MAGFLLLPEALSIGDEGRAEGRMKMNAIAVKGPLVGRFIPEESAGRIAALAGFAIVGSLILWASAKVHVPFWPVPMTLQTGAVALIAAAYGWRLGFATVVLYLLEGALGCRSSPARRSRGSVLPICSGRRAAI